MNLATRLETFSEPKKWNTRVQLNSHLAEEVAEKDVEAALQELKEEFAKQIGELTSHFKSLEKAS